VQQLEPLCRQLCRNKRDACNVATRPVETGDEPGLDRVNTDNKDDWDRRGRRFSGECRRAADGRYYGHLTTNQIGRQARQSIVLALRPTVFDRDVLALDVASFVETLPEGGQTESSDSGDPGLR
jgi:hypothetical protein